MTRRWDADAYTRLERLLRRERLDTGLTQTQLAQRLGVRQEWVSRYECGERRLDVIELSRVAKALGLDVVTVMARIGLIGGRKE